MQELKWKVKQMIKSLGKIESWKYLNIRFDFYKIVTSPGGPDGKESICNTGDLGLILGSGRSPGEGKGNPFQYSCLRTRTPWTEESGGLQTIGSQRVRHDWTVSTFTSLSGISGSLLPASLPVIVPFLVPLSTPDSLWGSSQIQKSQNPQVHNHFTLLEYVSHSESTHSS